MHTNLTNYVQNWIDKNTDWIFNIVEFCMVEGYYSYNDIVDDDGNILDRIEVITAHDMQEACDALGFDIDCINF